MRVLILGGTRFVGRHLTQAALDRGHQVTLLHRGKSGADLFPSVDRILADRGETLDFGDQTWDAVIDTSGYVPRVVRSSAEALRARAGHYLFVSTISVYASPKVPGAGEDAPLEGLADPTIEEITGETYGGLKVLCEQAVDEIWGTASTVVRPGLIVGPNDHTLRFPYWVRRYAEGGRFVVPETNDLPVQMIDARDLANFMLDLSEGRTPGTYNATGPASELTAQALFATLGEIFPEAQPVFIPMARLEAEGVEPWGHLPFILRPEDAGIMQVSIARALSAGLSLRRIEDTIRDTAAWIAVAKPTLPEPPGIPADLEARVLSQVP